MATETREIAHRQQAGQLATDAPANPWGDLALLTPHGGEQRPRRIESIATISAGYRDQGGMPVISRDGTIYMTDDPIHPAIGLRQALAARSNKALTIAFGVNDPKAIIQQRLTTYSKTRLEAWGDHEQITLINLRSTGRKDSRGALIMEPIRETIRRDSDPERYAAQAATMKAETFVYFFLARWLKNGDPEIYLPDGFVSYRLRFTSLNSAQSIVNQLFFIGEKMGGKIAGIPLDLFITYRELADPSGAKRRVPIWTLVLRPPDELQLNTAAALQGIFRKSIAQAEALALPAPTMLTDDQLALEGPDIDLDDPKVIDGHYTITADDSRKLRGGGPIGNPDRFRAEFFTAIRGSSLDEREGGEGYERFLLASTGGRTGSLAEFCRTATNADGNRLLEAVADQVRREIEARTEPPAPRDFSTEQRAQLDETRRLLDVAFDDPLERMAERRQAVSRAPVQMGVNVTPEVAAAVQLTGGPAPAAPARPEHGGEYSPDEWRAFYGVWSAELRSRDSAYVVWPDSQIKRASVGQLIEETMSCIGQCDSIDEAIYLADLDDAREGEQAADGEAAD